MGLADSSRAQRAASREGHTGEKHRLRVLELEVLIRELFAVNALAASAIMVREIAALVRHIFEGEAYI